MIPERELRRIAAQIGLGVGQAEHVKEKASYLNASLARQLLIQKCQHRWLEAPETRDFLLPQRLAEAEVYWERDMIAQIPGSLLPDWKVVVGELAGLLEAFFSRG